MTTTHVSHAHICMHTLVLLGFGLTLTIMQLAIKVVLVHEHNLGKCDVFFCHNGDRQRGLLEVAVCHHQTNHCANRRVSIKQST